jgi:NAD(P)-dependent dehydrogenase (short-subunit alcohol dehydrogenase family)
MTKPFDFQDRVAVITGAGAGLGRAYALELARRGAKIVVNDLGIAAAQAVAKEITDSGGSAIAHGASISDEAAVNDMTEAALRAYGAVDILIANAGIIRDKSFAKMEIQDFRAVFDVHVMGSVIPAKAVWPIMREQSYGRILFTTSASGLFGNFGQANYGAAKMALVGLMNTLKIEGARDNVRVNCLSPVAATGMTSHIFSDEIVRILPPEAVAQGATFLVSEDAPTGAILAVAGGGFALNAVLENDGAALGAGATAEDLAKAWASLSADAPRHSFENMTEQTERMFRLAGRNVDAN